MKKCLLLCVFCLLASVIFAQNCKYAKLKPRHHSVNITKQTKFLYIASKGLGGVNGQFFIQYDSLFLTLNYNSQIKKTRRVHASDPIVLRSSSGESLEINPVRDAQSSFHYQGLLSSTSFAIKLYISPEDLERLKTESFQSVEIITHLKKGGQQTEVLNMKPANNKGLNLGATCIDS